MIIYIYNQMLYLQELGNFTWRVSDCKELVGVNQTCQNHPLNSLKFLSKHILRLEIILPNISGFSTILSKVRGTQPDNLTT